MNVFGTFCDTIFTPKEWFLSKKGPKEGERVARGHFHERVGETPVHISYQSVQWRLTAVLVNPTGMPILTGESCVVMQGHAKARRTGAR